MLLLTYVNKTGKILTNVKRGFLMTTNNSTDLDLFFFTLEKFAGRPCPDKEKAIWSRILKQKNIAKKESLIHVGEIPTEFYFIVRGLTRQYYIDASGNEVTRGFAAEHEFVCTEVLIQGNSSLFNIEALEDCRMLVFRLAELDELRDSDFMKDVYIGALEKNVKKRLIRDSVFLMNDARGRYEKFVEGDPELVERLKKSDIASYLGMTAESLSRIRRAIKENN